MSNINLIKLRIKAKHLATEPAIIRKEEYKLTDQEGRADLAYHRKWDVRNESRATQLALLFLKGREYSKAEKKRLDEYKFKRYIVPRIVTMVNKYSGTSPYNRIPEKDILDWAKITDV